MKIATSCLAGLFLTVILEANNTALTAADGVIYKQELTSGSYCHRKFPAIREETLAGDHPVLKDPSDGDIIDFYGPCDEDPLGKDQVHRQTIENEHRRDRGYSD
jgi:hypothetical protein